MSGYLHAHLKALALAGLLLSLAGPVMAQAVPGDEVASVDTPSDPVDCSGPGDSTDPVTDDTPFQADLGSPDLNSPDLNSPDEGEIDPAIYYSMGAEGCMVCRGGDGGAEEVASEVASEAAERAVDQLAPTPSDPAP
jgi:hypothetical protein